MQQQKLFFEPLAELEKHKYPSILDTEEHFQIEEHCGKIPTYWGL